MKRNYLNVCTEQMVKGLDRCKKSDGTVITVTTNENAIEMTFCTRFKIPLNNLTTFDYL